LGEFEGSRLNSETLVSDKILLAVAILLGLLTTALSL
jgi:hypothetical protein